MNGVRAALGGAGFGLAFVAAGAAVLGLLGGVSGWADVANHFAPVWLVAAWSGALIARAALAPGWRRSAAMVVAATAVLVAGAPMVAEAVAGLRQPQPSGPVLKVLTYNRLFSNKDLDASAAMIRRSGADLVAVQEAASFAPSAADKLGDVYPYQFACPNCDTLILSKQPILATGRDEAEREAIDLIWVRTTAPDGGPVTLATVHFFWPVPPHMQRYQRDRLHRLLKPVIGDTLVLTGDFNSAPWSFGLRELDRRLEPLTRRTHGMITFAANWPVPLLAIDQVYAGPGWKGVRIERGSPAGSDHYPVLATLSR